MRMKADYDSEADAISIVLRRFRVFDHEERVDEGDNCHVGIVDGQAVEVELLYPARHLGLLSVAADRYGLDGSALVAITKAALAAPDRLVTMGLSGSLVA
jgi:hypothetical protein